MLTKVWGKNEPETSIQFWDHTTWQKMTNMRCSWTLYPGSSIGARDMESSMILLNGSLSFWSISAVLLPKMKRIGSMVDATSSTLTWQVHPETATTWGVARHCQMFWDIAETRPCLLEVEAWTSVLFDQMQEKSKTVQHVWSRFCGHVTVQSQTKILCRDLHAVEVVSI